MTQEEFDKGIQINRTIPDLDTYTYFVNNIDEIHDTHDIKEGRQV